MPVPYDHLTDYKCGIHDIDADTSGRNDLTGDMHRDRVNVKRTVNFTLSYINIEQMSTILQLIKNPDFTVKYFDTQDAVVKTGIFNCGDREPEFCEGSCEIYKPMKFEFTEV